MSRTKQKPARMTTVEKVSSTCLVLSLLANVYLGFSTHALQVTNSASERRLQAAELRLREYESEPRIVQGYLILPGNSFKAFAAIDWTKATIENGAHPEFVETPLGTEIYDLVASEDAMRALKSIQVTFMTLRNDGKSLARNVTLVTDKADQQLSLGNIPPGVTKLIPVQMVRSQPQLAKSDSRAFAKCVYGDEGPSGNVQHEVAVAPRSETSWIPSLDALRGVGRALVVSDNEHLFR